MHLPLVSPRLLLRGAVLLSLTLSGCVAEHPRGYRGRATAASIQRRAYYADQRFDRDEYYQASLDPYYVLGEYDGPDYYGYGGRLPGYGWGDRYSRDRSASDARGLYFYPGTTYRRPVRAGAVHLHSRGVVRGHR